VKNLAENRSRARRVAFVAAKIVAAGIAFMAIFLTSGYLTMRLALMGSGVTVPDVTGLTATAASESLLKDQLFLETTAQRHDDRLESGRVLAQEPPAGSKIKKYRKVKVVMSLGPRVFKVPDVRGQSLRAARLAIESEGLKAGRVAYASTPLVESGVVVSQDPLPSGENLGESGVSLLVSKGPREPVYVMPRLVGLDSAAVQPALRARGLKIGLVRRDRASSAAAGTIVKQYPEAGYPVAAGDAISLVIGE